MRRSLASACLFTCALAAGVASAAPVEVGVRPQYLISRIANPELKARLEACLDKPQERKQFSIAHRGAPLQFPEHTAESYMAAYRMGAGIQECDVAFTKDKQLVCRHAQNDLHTTTNILATDLAKNCTKPFQPAEGDKPASAECRTSDITLAEFKTLTGKMDAANTKATTADAYMKGTANWRTDLYAAGGGTLMTHVEYIALVRKQGLKFTPELKSPAVAMPYEGWTQEQYAQAMIDEYKAAGVPPQDVFPQSFNLADILYWIKAEPEFGKQAVFLDERDETDTNFDYMNAATFKPSMAELKAMGVNYIAPSMPLLVTVQGGKIAPSTYAREAKAAGLKIITWSLERSGPLHKGGGYYYKSINSIVTNDGVIYELLDVLTQQVGIEGIFSDWPATVTFYANCMNLK
ncbi:glycerophosphodiester phosphodiesterase [Azospirillum sp. RWY-5-1]|uniref:glycerophosphodiester phosphodiesterase n=1 Tax=Azospirillum oleiclasticum TaxID=2735135 RepID=A0ABX2T5B7_9PROT|nr:glycerophosphodiester phosphodiesterase family protein [Azospirillum oleiclasticum]NYZ11171.1 glycerophosphodiester phosphodiesterase [Azospirillum oleiclasticum]NYZ18333.1 glycerophosphodiester phosphodiesterase [Azospirillum oleiclasticum]